MNYLSVLEKYYENCSYGIGDNYDSLFWYDTNTE